MKDILLRAIPVEGDRCYTIGESLIVVLEHGNLLQHTASINVSLLIKWYFYWCDKSYSDRHPSLRNNTLEFFAICSKLCLHDAVDELRVSNFQSCDLSEVVDSSDRFIDNCKVLLNVTSLNLLTIWSSRWSTKNSEGISHIWSKKKISWWKL